MSVYAIERVKQIMEYRVNLALSELVENTPLIEQVERWLVDDASLESYRRELTFMMLRHLLKDDQATLHYAANIAVAEWEILLLQAEKMMKNGELPHLEYPPSPDWMLPYLYASTFLLGQYQYAGAVEIQRGDVFLDCGGCGGETAIWALRSGAGKVYSFEPNPEILPFLRRNIERHCPPGSVETVARAVGDMPGMVNLVQGMENIGGSCLHGGVEGVPVPVVTLDGWCRERGVCPSYIKMDLEGFEVAALHGARETIAKHRPKLAISVYHRLSDMWVIPALIKDIYAGYRLYCRKNALMTEFVLYAVAQ